MNPRLKDLMEAYDIPLTTEVEKEGTFSDPPREGKNWPNYEPNKLQSTKKLRFRIKPLDSFDPRFFRTKRVLDKLMYPPITITVRGKNLRSEWYDEYHHTHKVMTFDLKEIISWIKFLIPDYKRNPNLLRITVEDVKWQKLLYVNKGVVEIDKLDLTQVIEELMGC